MTNSNTFVLLNEEIRTNLYDYINDLPIDGTIEVVIGELKAGKTLKQLGGLFAVWVKYLASELGESEDYVHRMLKAKFLARIYISEPMTPSQEQWVELLAIYQERDEQEKLLQHAKRISLSWARLVQMKSYLSAIEQHYQAEGIPLPVFDPYWKGEK